MHCPLWMVALIFIGSIDALVTAYDQPSSFCEGWGQPVDPLGDCKVRVEAEKLKIDVPGKKHDLTAETGDMNAPRILRPIDGDFIAQVLVSGNIRHAGVRTSTQFNAYHGAGILLWLNDKTYIRLERAGVVVEDGRFVHYANFEIRQDGQAGESSSIQIRDRDTYLRIERRGNHVYGSTSVDGVNWMSSTPIAVTLPKEVKVGVAAINTSSEPLKVVFSELEVFKKEPKVAAK